MLISFASGLFGLTSTTMQDGAVRPVFERVEGFQAQVFDVLSTANGLLAATTKGVYRVSNGTAQSVGRDRTAFSLHASRFEDGLVYVGYIDGIESLRSAGDGWTAGEALENFDQEIHFMGEDDEEALWASSSYGGLWRIETTDGLRGNPSVQKLGEEGQTPRHAFRMTQLEDGLRIVTRSGLARPIVGETGQVILEPDSSLQPMLPEGADIVDLKSAPDGDRWVFTTDGVFRLQPRAGEGGYIISEPLARAEDLSVFATRAEAGGLFWVAGEEGVLRHAPRPDPRPAPTIATLIRRVATVEADSLIFGGKRAAAAQTPVLDADHNALRFEFAATGFGNESAIEYQYRLVGFDGTWSEWTDEARKDYTNLPAGSYTFEVRGRNPGLWQANPASFSVTIEPPWYQTAWAYLLYILLGVGLVAGAVWWRSAHLEARARRLEERIAERTAEVKEQAERLEAYNNELQQTNVALQEALEQKSELLGIAAHDLKNPLFGIRGLTEILIERDDLDEGMRRKLDLIHDSADETLKLINDLLESVAASSGQVQLELEDLNMVSVGEWVVHGFEAQAENKDQDLKFIAKHPDCPIKADQRRLREAMARVAQDELETPRDLPYERRDEVGDLVRTFNEMRAQLAESRRKLARQERELAWREMARQVAHEIKNPLTPMKLSIQHLRRAFERADDAAESSNFAEVFDRITSTLIEQVESLVRIADEFSTFARLPTRVPEPVDLTEVIQEAASLMEEEAANHDALTLDLPDDPLVVEADREELRRIYINLIKNAIQAVPSDRTARIRIATAPNVQDDDAASQAQSWVADNGVGIPPAEHDKIFQPNFSTKTSGTGLGLAIARKTIRELDGEIGFNTREGEGTTFWIHLPLAE